MNDEIKLNGHISIRHIRDGEVIDTREVKNLIVDSGKALIITGLCSGISTQFTYIGVGTGTTAAVTGNTTLEIEVPAISRAAITATSSTNVASFIATWNNVSTSKNITEAGIFNASSSGTMLSRQVFDPVILAATDSLAITWTITLN